jgi:hypothetical protein
VANAAKSNQEHIDTRDAEGKLPPTEAR